MSASAPTDPRDGLTPLGAMPQIAELEEGVVRILAPNASPMTLDGTNTYLVYGRNGGAYLVDPGPVDDAHFVRIAAQIENRELDPRGVVLTHHHIDHAESAHRFSREWSVPIFAGALEDPARPAVLVSEGDSIEVDGQRLTAMRTPGHTADHLCFTLPSGRALTGDHVLGRGTSVVAYPDGDLERYLQSLLQLEGAQPKGMYPGHGPELSEESAADVLDYYISHRLYRIGQVLEAFSAVRTPVAEAVRGIYGQSIPPGLFFAAELSTRAAISMLVSRGYLEPAGDEDHYVRAGAGVESLLGELVAERRRPL
ncbi:MAG: MBL fold metallo-hydrolase [Actinomycetota bacterium]|nr:MBL fold metallo-hydrolase [Actinomycetota bacterium]